MDKSSSKDIHKMVKGIIADSNHYGFRWLRSQIQNCTSPILNSLLLFASKKGVIRDVELLLPLMIIKCNSDDISEALVEASSQSHTSIMKLLISNGANVQYKNNLSLKNAVIGGHSDAVKLLLDHGADIHVDNDDLVAICCEAGDYDDVLLLLIEYGIDISKKYQLAVNLSFSKKRNLCTQVLINYSVDNLDRVFSSISLDNEELLTYSDMIEDVTEYNESQTESFSSDSEIDEE